MILKCKMCGGDLNITAGSTICECDFCGTQQTVPAADDEKRANLFNRANRLRMNAEFDRAAAVYVSITAEFPEEAEAYWGQCLCKYGIEYVDDPATGNKVPTCHRTLTASILDDSDFEQACEYADAISRRLYRDEAKAIDRIQKGILTIVANEAPYDVFICYKETAEEGGRTEDSVLAQDIYDSLTGRGLKVFFARITLEDKLGQQYEPYIYAALSSAKVMLAVGTKFEYYDAVWVKNEWMRFLSMMKTDRSKTLIPCFKDVDAYDIPKEFRQLQAQDMGKLGWLQDLTRGVVKLCGKEMAPAPAAVGYGNGNASETAPLLRRAELFLQDQEWAKADEYIDRVLDKDPENAQAYWLRLLTRYRCDSDSRLIALRPDLQEDKDYRKALRFSDGQLRMRLERIPGEIGLRDAREWLAWVLQARIAHLEKREEQDRRTVGRAAALVNDPLASVDGLMKARQELRSVRTDATEELIRQCESRAMEILRQQLRQANTVYQVRMVENKRREFIAVESFAPLKQECEERDREVRREDMLRLREKAESLVRRQAEWRQGIRQAEGLADEIRRRCEEQRSAYQNADQAAQKAIQASQRAVAARNQASAEVRRLNEELSQLRGLFSGKRRAEVEARLRQATQRLADEEANCARLDAETKQARERVLEAPDAREEKYGSGMAYYSAGMYGRAKALFEQIKGYRDVDAMLEQDKMRHAPDADPFGTPGRIVAFGSYPLADEPGSAAPILWKVLEHDATDHRSLLISVYGVDAYQYNEFADGDEPEYSEEAEEDENSDWNRWWAKTNEPWENSDIRRWLNETFLHAAFSDKEQQAILLSNVDNSRSQSRPESSADDGRDTRDRVFLLSYAEAKRCFVSDDEWMCLPTGRAYSKVRWHTSGDYFMDGSMTVSWWLRSLESKGFPCEVTENGRVKGSPAGSTNAVRPAVWIDTSAIC